MNKPLVLLTNPVLGVALEDAARSAAAQEIHIATSLEELEALASSIGRSPLLVSCGTGVIVPTRVIRVFEGSCYNIHPASPDFPGRDPHHFAAYAAAQRYGATLHVMTPRVDDGDIVGVDLVDVPPSATPKDLLDIAEAAAVRLLRLALPDLLDGKSPEPLDIEWGARKTRRDDFEALCRVSCLMSEQELERRRHATHMPPYKNLYVDLHGQRFRHDGPAPAQGSGARGKWDDFTETAYAALLDAAKARYRFASFVERGQDRHVLWRHDVDHSIHRAVRLAELDHERGLLATYFFALRLPYYNMLEPDIAACACRVAELGHRIGLHFDASAYPNEAWTQTSLEARLEWEKSLLTELIGAPVEAVSFHDPSHADFLAFDQPTLAGMVNAYSAELKQAYGYCSDSNGYWRFEPISDVIASEEFERLHVLTHPEWWTREAMAPRRRIERALLGRARSVMAEYDDHLSRSGRLNIE